MNNFFKIVGKSQLFTKSEVTDSPFVVEEEIEINDLYRYKYVRDINDKYVRDINDLYRYKYVDFF
jgi:hypothetical protein